MKKIVLLLVLVILASTPVLAEGESGSGGAIFGARAGYSFSPDQFFLGGHVDLGQIAGPLRLVPNIEIGLGGDVTVFAFNGDLIYDFESTPWGVGGELGVIYSTWDDHGFDIDSSSTDIGLSVLGEYRFALNNGKTLTAQAKFGLANSPDVKIMAGYNF